MRRLLAVVALLAAGSACSRGGDDGALRIELDGRAVVGDETLDAGTHRLDPGDVVEIEEGSGVVALPGAGTVELRTGSKLEVDDEPVLLAGDALLAGEALTVSADGTTVALSGGAARMSRATGVAIAVYRGTAGVRSGGRSLPGGLPALRQVVVPDAGLLPRRVSPLAYADEPDPWDRRWLGPAIDLGAELDARSVGLSAGRSEADDVVVALAGDSAPAAAAGRSPGEAAVGAAIAAVGEGGSLEERLAAAFAFRDQGARWGLVALDRAADREPLLAALDGALDEEAPVLFASAPAGAGGGATPSVTVPSGSTTSPPSTGPPPTGPPPPDDPPPTTSPPPTTPPPTVPTPTIPPTTPPPVTIPGPVEEIVGGLLGG